MFKKIILAVFALAALILAIAAGFYVWFIVQSGPATTPVTTTGQTTSTASGTAPAYVIPANKLTPAQQTMAKTMGLDLSSGGLTITQAEYQCAVAKLGAARMQEIVNGATPTFSEGLTLYSCK